VKAPRFRISSLMVAVAIAALDSWAIVGVELGNAGILLVFGVLPMANVLVVGLLAARHRPTNRPYLLGFEAFGATALAFYILLVTTCHGQDGPIFYSIEFVGDALRRIIGQDHPFFIPIAWFLLVVVLGAPQLALALIGGILSRRFKILIVRR
jgi:hypothetical protein